MSQTYRFKSVSTGVYIASTAEDKPGQDVKTGGDVSNNTILFVTPAITGDVTVVTITGVSGLYVSLVGTAENTRLTWSDNEYNWLIRANSQGTKYINPTNGADLYWFEQPGIVGVVTVKAGKDIQPPEAEWLVAPA